MQPPKLKRQRAMGMEEKAEDEDDPDMDKGSVSTIRKKAGSFFRNMKYLLTYKTWLDKQELKEFLQEKAKTVEIHICHESGHHNTKYEHTHAAIWYKERWEGKETALDFKEIHPNVKVIGAKKEDWLKVKRYIAKEDKQCSYILGELNKKLTLKERIMSIQQCKTINEAMFQANKFSEVHTNIEIFKQRTIESTKKVIEEKDLKGWQTQILPRLTDAGEDRKIIWIIDEKGGLGKTKLRQYLVAKHGYFALTGYMKMGDLANLLSQYCEKQEPPKRFLFDLTRTVKEYDSIYGLMENVRNGDFQTGKYQGFTGQLEVTHTVVFSNWEPDYRKLSKGRWELFKIKKDTGEECDEEPIEMDPDIYAELVQERIEHTILERYNIKLRSEDGEEPPAKRQRDEYGLFY